MDIAAEPARPEDGAPELHGQRIDWTPRDVLFGILWFLGLFLLAPIPIIAPFYAFGDESTELYAAQFVASALAEVSIVVVAASFTFRKYGGGWERLGFKTPTGATWGWAVAALVGAFAVSYAWGIAIEALDIEALKSACDDQIPDTVLESNFLMALATIVIIAFAPICEETFFRGFITTGLLRWGMVAAALASGLLFSAAHIGPNMHKTIVPIFGIGVVFGLAYLRSGNILSTVAAHLAFNSLSTIGLWTCDPGA